MPMHVDVATTTKALAIVGLVLNAIGTVLLWKSSPASTGGFSPNYSPEIQAQMRAVAARMRLGQRAAIGLLMAGAAFQFPSILFQ
jgi:hypothetical protein